MSLTNSTSFNREQYKFKHQKFEKMLRTLPVPGRYLFLRIDNNKTVILWGCVM